MASQAQARASLHPLLVTPAPCHRPHPPAYPSPNQKQQAMDATSRAPGGRQWMCPLCFFLLCWMTCAKLVATGA